ncbi:MAG: hypothetical protein M3619_22920, partial [Myxococcota bacterium]|nr:hypothetical protein [Myxococcota bacterium]
MIWLALAISLIVATVLIGAWRVRQRAAPNVTVMVPVDLAPRIEAAARALASAPPWHAATQPDVPET